MGGAGEDVPSTPLDWPNAVLADFPGSEAPGVKVQTAQELVAKLVTGDDLVYDQFGSELRQVNIQAVFSAELLDEGGSLGFWPFENLVEVDGIHSSLGTHDGDHCLWKSQRAVGTNRLCERPRRCAEPSLRRRQKSSSPQHG